MKLLIKNLNLLLNEFGWGCFYLEETNDFDFELLALGYDSELRKSPYGTTI